MSDYFVPVLIFLGIFAGIFFGVGTLRSAVCHNQAEEMQVESKWRWVGGCFVEIDGKWVPLKNYRVLD